MTGIVTLTGPTCGGKTTVERHLQTVKGWGRAISHTTRKPRTGEVNGVDYHFITHGEFERMIQTGDFVETVKLGSNYYAMSGAALQLASQAGVNACIVVDPEGADQIISYCRAQGIPTLSVWLDCGPEVQARRYMGRIISDKNFTAAPGVHAERLAMMLKEEAIWRADAADHLIIKGSPNRYGLLLSTADIDVEGVARWISAHATL